LAARRIVVSGDTPVAGLTGGKIKGIDAFFPAR
jgi:hypothetical protein